MSQNRIGVLHHPRQSIASLWTHFMVRRLSGYRYCLYVILAAPLWHLLFANYLYNSDYALGFVAAREFIEGNFLLRGWTIGNDSFYTTDLLWQCLLSLFITDNEICARTFSTLSLCLLYCVVWQAVLSCLPAFADEDNSFAKKLLPELVFCVATTMFIGMASHIYGTPSRVMTIFLGLSASLLMFARQKSLWRCCAILLFATCAFTGDKYSYAYLLAPVVIVWLFGVFSTKKLDAYIFLLLIALIISLFLRNYLSIYGFSTPGIQLRFVEFLQIPNQLLYCLGGIFRCVNAWFWGKSIADPQVVINIFFTIVLLIVIYAYIVAMRYGKIYIYKSKAWLFLLLSSVCVCCAYIFTSLPIPAEFPQFRYFTAIFINAVPFVILAAVSWLKRYFIQSRLIGFILIAGCIVLLISMNFYKSPAKEIASLKEISQILADRGHKYGYGEFWSASAAAFYGNGKQSIKPVLFQDGRYKPYEWMSKNEDSTVKHTFIIKNDSNNFPGFETDKILAAFGKPVEYLQIAGYEIFCYDKSITLRHEGEYGKNDMRKP